MIPGLCIGFAIAGTLFLVRETARRLAARRAAWRQDRWNAEIDEAVALGEAAVQRGAASLTYAAGGVALVLAIAGIYVGARLTSEKTITCTVTDKDRTTKVTSDGNGGTTSSSDARIYTEDCGTLQVADELLVGQFTSADTYASIEAGRRYEFRIIGWRIGFLSQFPNVIEASEVGR